MSVIPFLPSLLKLRSCRSLQELTPDPSFFFCNSISFFGYKCPAPPVSNGAGIRPTATTTAATETCVGEIHDRPQFSSGLGFSAVSCATCGGGGREKAVPDRIMISELLCTEDSVVTAYWVHVCRLFEGPISCN